MMRVRQDLLTRWGSPERVGRSAASGSKSRGHQVRRTIAGGSLGGGALLAGFGIVPAIGGAIVGGLLGYLFERSVGEHDANRAG